MLQKLYPKSRIGHPAPCLWVPVPDTNRRPRDRKTKRQMMYCCAINGLRMAYLQTEDRETKRPKDPYDALRIEHPTPSRGGGAGGGGNNTWSKHPCTRKRNLKKKFYAFLKSYIVFFIVLFYKLDVFQSYPPVRVDTIYLII